jgi:peptidylprolyl isomerase
MEEEEQRLASYGVIPAEDTNPLAEKYRIASDAFRKATAEFADMQARLQFRLDMDIPEAMKEKWLAKLKAGFEALVAWRDRAADLYASDPERYETVGVMLREMLVTEAASDRFDHWTHAARSLMEGGRLIDEEVALSAGYVGFANCDWELASMAWIPLAKEGKLPEIETKMLENIPSIAAAWEEEQERIRQDETKNNPRVEFVTTKGIIEIELFEDDAPEAVASFIYLIEKGYYHRKPIFMVKRHWLAQTGCEKGDGKGTAGYTIPFEAGSPTHRNHFRGYLAIPLGIDTEKQTIEPNSGGAQFYFSYLPLPIFDAKHTVFGRIVSGMETLGMFKEVNLTDEEQRKDTTLQPDRVVMARVLRKRDHDYVPKTVFGRLPR